MKTRAITSAAALAVALLGWCGACAGASGPCQLLVTSRPPEAEVYVDGKKHGMTPAAIMGLTTGAHEVRVVLEGYRPWTKRVSLRPGGKTLMVELKREGPAQPEAPRAGSGSGPSGDPAPGGRDDAPKVDSKPAARPADKPADKKPPRLVKVSCPACKGSGLIKETGCPDCEANGHAWQRGTLHDCGSCQRSGRAVYECYACEGAGTVAVRGKEVECRLCRGKGAPPCGACKGTGKIFKPNPEAASYPTRACASCGGAGYEQQEKCRRCGGQGKVTLTRGDSMYYYPGVECPRCGGVGTGPRICLGCRGRGYVGPRGPRKIITPCPRCFGTGHLFPPCRSCGGKGWGRSR